MAVAPFAQAMADLGTEVESMLANATATYQGGEPFGVLFDRAASDPFGQAVDVAALSVGYCVLNTPGVREGSELTIDGVVHKVTGPVQPDAGGWVNLTVYPKA